MKSNTFDPGDIRLFSGSSNPVLAEGVASFLGLNLEKTLITRFSNDNLYIQLGASVRSRIVFIVQSLAPPVNDHLVELLMMLDIARSAAATEVHAIIPYYSFARSDKKDAPRICITARLVADLLKTAGATHILTMVLHSPQVHGFFPVPTDILTSRLTFKNYFMGRNLQNTIVVTPDMGNIKSAARFAKNLGLPVVAGSKERISDTKVVITAMVGQPIKGFKRAIIYDDEIATGSSILEIARVLVSEGVEDIQVVCTHGVFVRGGLQLLEDFPAISEIVTTDTVYIPDVAHHPKLKILSVASVFGEAIRLNYLRQSINELFIFGNDMD